jgi:hypothetical protein
MSNPGEPFKINLNQNLWGLVVGLVGLGVAEHFNLCTLFWFSVVVSVVTVASVGVTTLAYTINYWKNKQGRG